MPVKDGRQYRFSQMFTPAGDPGTYMVEGYATTFDDPYEMYEIEGRKYYEVIDSHALDGADMSDVIFQYNHGGMVMARLRNDTLRIERDAHGLKTIASLGGSQEGRNLYEAMSNGLIDRMSWAFTVADDGWEYDPATCTSTIRRISKVYDVSAVSIPANEGTEIYARSYLDGVIEREKRESLLREEEKAQAQRRLVQVRMRLLGVR